MKRIMYNAMIIMVLVINILGGVTLERLINNTYIREGVVVATDSSTEEVITVDTTGNEWCFYGIGYMEGDSVTMIMDNNKTNNIINDDIIQNVIVNTY